MSDYTQEAILALELARVRAERDALAAHVERIHALANVANLLEADDVCNQLVALDDESPATSLAKLKAQCWKEAYLTGMEAGHHWTVEGGYIPGGDEEAAEDYVADRQAEGGQQ